MGSWFGGKKDDDAKNVGEDMQKLSEQIGELQQKLAAKTTEADNLRTQASQNLGSSVALEDANAQLEVLRNQIAEMKAKAEQASATTAGQAAPAKSEPAGPVVLGDLHTDSAPSAPAEEGTKSRAVNAGGLAVGSSAWVTQAGGLPLRLRSAASLHGDILGRLQPGTEMTLLDGPQQADGHAWWHIRTTDGQTGWVAGEDLRTQPD